MKVKNVRLENFRRLEAVEISFEKNETIFVGPNNSGKTSVTAAFRKFVGGASFNIHDFSVPKIAQLDAIGQGAMDPEIQLPFIQFDVWFDIDPSVEFGRVFALLPDVSSTFERVGIRILFSANDQDKLLAAFRSDFLAGAEPSEGKELSDYLAMSGVLGRHFSLKYYALDEQTDGLVCNPLEPDEARSVMKSLLRVDFVDAQRNIDDQESARNNRLSAAFAEFYKHNLREIENREEANRVVAENNQNLSQHFAEQFQPLLNLVKGLGVPGANDRELRIISDEVPESALQGKTSLIYFDSTLQHSLPESYNGLGFKNLIFLAVQISHFHLQWLNTEISRPLCQLIFIEEPEVHLHAQVQQVFIKNIWEALQASAEASGEATSMPQLGITTHSSHILDAAEFGKIRYFKRCHFTDDDVEGEARLNATKVVDLNDFDPLEGGEDGADEANSAAILVFLKRYLRLTHCDLFFADAAILIEGAVEKLLLPEMIKRGAPDLGLRYLTILEVGGAYAYRFEGLMKFLGIPYIVITDIDSIDPDNDRKTCRADKVNAVTSNSSLKNYFPEYDQLVDLHGLDRRARELTDGNGLVCYQTKIDVGGVMMLGRTLEEAFIYENADLVRAGSLKTAVALEDTLQGEDLYEAVYKKVKSSSFKKVEFALDVMVSDSEWRVPEYVADGLQWLSGKCAAE